MDPFVVWVPDSMKDFFQSEIASGGYTDPSAYICFLLRTEQKRKAKEVLEELVHDALESPAEEITPAFWEGLRQKL